MTEAAPSHCEMCGGTGFRVMPPPVLANMLKTLRTWAVVPAQEMEVLRRGGKRCTDCMSPREWYRVSYRTYRLVTNGGPRIKR